MHATSDDLDETIIEGDDLDVDDAATVSLAKPAVESAPKSKSGKATAKAAKPDKSAKSASKKSTKPPATDEAVSAAPTKPLTKAEKLEARAARLREAEVAREQRRLEAASAPAGASGGNSLPWIISTTVLAVLLAVGLGIGIPYALDKHDAYAHNAALSTARTQALATAEKAAVAFGSYNYADVDKTLNATLQYLTPKFRSQYSPVVAQLKPYISKGQAVATASVRCAAVSHLSTTRAVIVLCLDQSVTTSASKTATINRNRAVATLVKQKNGRWLVDDLVLR